MKKLSLLLFALLLFSCGPFKGTGSGETQSGVNFNDLKIQKGQVGKIKIGMTIQEAEKQLSGLTKKEDEAVVFGFGGGSPVYLYYWKDEVVLGLIPKLQTDSLLFILAAHKNLETENGLHPNSSVRKLLKKYPDLTLQQDLMNGWEFFHDEVNGWDFVFTTDKDTQIGEHQEAETPVKPTGKRLNTKASWITIRGEEAK